MVPPLGGAKDGHVIFFSNLMNDISTGPHKAELLQVGIFFPRPFTYLHEKFYC